LPHYFHIQYAATARPGVKYQSLTSPGRDFECPEGLEKQSLGADSLDTVELVMALEEEFETEIPDEDAEKITTVQQAIDFVTSRQKKD